LIVHKGSVKVRITCPPNVIRLCVGKDTLSTVSAFAVSIMRSKKHKLKLGATTFSIPAGSTKTLTIKLTAKARKLLAKKSRLAVLETVVAHDDRGTSKTATARITIRLAKKHRSH
jgi:hypothetical protein